MTAAPKRVVVIVDDHVVASLDAPPGKVPIDRPGAGHRAFSREQVWWLRLMYACGVPTSELANIMGAHWNQTHKVVTGEHYSEDWQWFYPTHLFPKIDDREDAPAE